MTAGLPFAGVTRCAHRAEEPPRGLPTGPGTEGRAVGGAGHLGRTPPATSAREGHGGCPGGVRARAFAGRLGARNPSSLRGRRAEGAGARTGARARACASVCTSVCVRVCVAVNGLCVCVSVVRAHGGVQSPPRAERRWGALAPGGGGRGRLRLLPARPRAGGLSGHAPGLRHPRRGVPLLPALRPPSIGGRASPTLGAQAGGCRLAMRPRGPRSPAARSPLRLSKLCVEISLSGAK